MMDEIEKAKKEAAEEEAANTAMIELVYRSGSRLTDPASRALFYILCQNKQLRSHREQIYKYAGRQVDRRYIDSIRVSDSAKALVMIGASLYDGQPLDIAEAFPRLSQNDLYTAAMAIIRRYEPELQLCD